MRLKEHKKAAPEINMIPMIDVIMMLLIFFLVATQMKKEENTYDLQLPESVKALIDALRDNPNSPITVNVISHKYAAPGKYFVVALDELTKEELTRTLQAASLVARERGDKSGQDTIVRIRADRDSLLEDLQSVLLSCQKAQIYKVYIAAERPRG